MKINLVESFLIAPNANTVPSLLQLAVSAASIIVLQGEPIITSFVAFNNSVATERSICSSGASAPVCNRSTDPSIFYSALVAAISTHSVTIITTLTVGCFKDAVAAVSVGSWVLEVDTVSTVWADPSRFDKAEAVASVSVVNVVVVTDLPCLGLEHSISTMGYRGEDADGGSIDSVNAGVPKFDSAIVATIILPIVALFTGFNDRVTADWF